MKVIKCIPNLLTLGNLFCGTLAAIFAVKGEFVTTAVLVILGIFFDFFDGFAARLLKVSGTLGKQLDSLADMVTSGVVPGIVMYNLLEQSNILQIKDKLNNQEVLDLSLLNSSYLKYFGLLLTLAACYRLAKFNLDKRQTDSFIGLPTPAMSLFVIFLPLIITYSNYSYIANMIQNTYFLISLTLILSVLMNIELPLFSLKFKNYNFKKNVLRYFFLIVSLLLIGTLNYIAVPLIIIVYILLSLIHNFRSSV